MSFERWEPVDEENGDENFYASPASCPICKAIITDYISHVTKVHGDEE